MEGLPIFLSGIVGPRGDGYIIGDRMTPEEAEAYHSLNIGILAEEGVDIINLETATYPEEAIGVVRAAKKVDKLIGVSFVLGDDGKLPCGMTLGDAIEMVDAATDGQPLYYGVNCTHASRLLKVLKGNIAGHTSTVFTLTSLQSQNHGCLAWER